MTFLKLKTLDIATCKQSEIMVLFDGFFLHLRWRDLELGSWVKV
jgi:hypothetical protein